MGTDSGIAFAALLCELHSVAKVGELDVALEVQEDVVALNVAMHAMHRVNEV